VTDDRANIKVDREAFRELKADKPDGVSWAYYLLEHRTLG